MYIWLKLLSRILDVFTRRAGESRQSSKYAKLNQTHNISSHALLDKVPLQEWREKYIYIEGERDKHKQQQSALHYYYIMRHSFTKSQMEKVYKKWDKN